MVKKIDKKSPPPPAPLDKEKGRAITNPGIDFASDAGAGQENVGVRDLIMPMLQLLQDMSPFVKKSDPAYIPGAEAGMLMNTATHELYDGHEGVPLVPCYYEVKLIEWVPRDAGGGLVAVYDEHDPIQHTTKKKPNTNIDMLPNGNDLVRTAQHYCLMPNEETGDIMRILVPLSSTGLKKSRLWNSLADNIRMQRADGTRYKPATFSHVYRLTTVPEKNKKGSYFNVQPAVEKVVDSPALYAAAKEFYDLVKSGEIRAVPQRDEVAERVGAEEPAEGNITKPEPGKLGGKHPY